MDSHRGHSAARLAVIASVTALVVVAATVQGISHRLRSELVEESGPLSAAERRTVRELAYEIVRDAPQPDEAHTARLRHRVRALSIREAAELGRYLQQAGHDDVVVWIRLPAQRERQAIEQLNELERRLHADFKKQPIVRGDDRLRAVCGDELLTEVTGVELRSEDDEGFLEPLNLTDTDLAVLWGFPGLERMVIDSAEVTDAGIEFLASRFRLKDVQLHRCLQLTDRSVQAIAQPQLERLDLTLTRGITDAGVAHLACCQRLQSLVLDETPVTSASLPAIARCLALKELCLNRTAVGAGLDQLRSLRRLIRLELSGLGSVDQPIPWQSLRFLSDCKTLEILDLQRTAVRRVELSHLPNLARFAVGHRFVSELELNDLPRLNQLAFAQDWMFFKDTYHLDHVSLRGVTGLTDLSIHGLTAPACDALARHIRDSKDLQQIYLFHCDMTDALAREIGRLPHLEKLVLDMAITSRQREMVCSAPWLRMLNCSGKWFTTADWSAMSESPLEELELKEFHVGDLGKGSSWRRLKRLDLRNCRIGRLHLGDLPVLDEIDVRESTIEDFDVTDCPRLARVNLLGVTSTRLRLEGCPAAKGFFSGWHTKLDQLALRNLPRLEDITIQERSSVQKLVLSELPYLKSVSFWYSDISSDFLRSLIDVPSLRQLDISSTWLGDDSVDLVSQMKGLEMLATSPWLTRTGLERLASLPKLNDVSLYHRIESDWTAAEARRMFPKMQHFCVFESDLPAAREVGLTPK